MKIESELKSKLDRHFENTKRRQYQENLLWLKKAQERSNDIYRNALNFQFKYKHSGHKTRVCPYLCDFTPVFLGSLYDRYYLKPQIKKMCKSNSLKVSGKIAPGFQGSFVYDQERKAYYKLEETLGRGSNGMGANKVKRAVNIDTHEEVAIKINRGSTNYLECEILKLLDRYRGDMLIPSMKHGLVNQYIIQTLIREKTLLGLVDTNLDIKQVNEIIHQAFNKLQSFHKIGIIVNDIKMDNILYDSVRNQLEFVDFSHSLLIKKGTLGNLINHYHDGDTTQIEIINEEKFIEYKKQDIRSLHRMLTEFLSKYFTHFPDLKVSIDQLKDKHLTLDNYKPQLSFSLGYDRG